MFRSHTSSAKNHNLSQRNGKAYNALCRLYICELSSYDLPKDLLFPLIIPLDHDHDGIADFEIRVLVMERVAAHDNCAVWEIAEHAAGVFARDACPAAAADGVAQACLIKRLRNSLLDGDLQGTGLAVKLLDHAGQLVARMILLPQVGNSRIAHITLRKIHIVAIAFDEASTRADGQHMARHTAARLVEWLCGEEIAP